MKVNYSEAGATAGAAIGSVIPVFGTSVGSAIGGVIGAIVDVFTGFKKSKKQKKALKRQYQAEVQALEVYKKELKEAVSEYRFNTFENIKRREIELSESPQEFRKYLERLYG